MTNKQDAGKDQAAEQTANRVVLALSTEQAEQLNNYFLEHGGPVSMLKIQQRIERTMTKQKIARENPDFTRKQLNQAVKIAVGESA